MMDQSNGNADEFAVDVESGRSDREDAGSVSVDDQASVCGSLVNSDADSVEGVVIDVKLENVDSAERKVGKEKCMKISNKKPPRPPRGPSLDSADQKLIREIAEMAMLKRIRTERVKALKKMKAVKQSSSSSNSLFAMIFTIIFFLVLLLQGISTRSSSHPILDVSPSFFSPEPDLISVQYKRKVSATDSRMPASRSPNLVELAYDQEPHEIAKSVSV